MLFKKYNSIENSYQEKFIDRMKLLGFHKETFVVQEKIHGANLSFHTDGKIIKIAKRTDFIQNDETFFNAHQILEKYRENVLSLFKELKLKKSTINKVSIFGEVFGGGYKHAEVPKLKNAIKVQKGIDYAPFNEFYAFDILVDDEYLDVKSANELFEKFGFFYAISLFEGSFEDALNYPKEFDSKIPDWLNLPRIENNLCEGTIIKPLKPLFLGNGNRVILKNKNEKWSEKVKVEKQEQQKIPMSEDAENLKNELFSLININRLNAVMSKIGQFEPKLIGKICGLLMQDALVDFEKENKISFLKLEKDEQKKLKKEANAFAMNVIKDEFLK